MKFLVKVFDNETNAVVKEKLINSKEELREFCSTQVNFNTQHYFTKKIKKLIKNA